MAVSKVIVNGVTKMDVSNVTATVEDVTSGKVFVKADGTEGIGICQGDTIEKLLTNTLTTYTNSTVTSIKRVFFEGNNSLQSVFFPNVTTIGEQCFRNCTNLTTAYFPSLRNGLGNYCFQNCTNLVNFDFSQITHVNPQQGFENTAITGVYSQSFTQVGHFTSSLFKNCTSLLYFRAPTLTKSTFMRDAVFYGCSSLKLVDVGSISKFELQNIFYGCTSLEVLILRRSDDITTLGNINSFTNVGTTQAVKVYCPSNLKDTYKAATNWVTLYTNGQVEFLNLENSDYESITFSYMGVPS